MQFLDTGSAADTQARVSNERKRVKTLTDERIIGRLPFSNVQKCSYEFDNMELPLRFLPSGCGAVARLGGGIDVTQR